MRNYVLSFITTLPAGRQVFNVRCDAQPALRVPEGVIVQFALEQLIQYPHFNCLFHFFQQMQRFCRDLPVNVKHNIPDLVICF